MSPVLLDVSAPARTDDVAPSSRLRELLHQLLEAFNRIRLPGPSVLPAAGAVVGLYSGLAAGLFANLIALVGGVLFRTGELSGEAHLGAGTTIWEAMTEASVGLDGVGADTLLGSAISPRRNSA